MPPKHSSVADAYNVLGLEQGASLENVKITYKQLALRTHPDKNPGNEDATAQFQRLSEAYSVLLKHLDGRGPSGYSPYGRYDNDDVDYYSEDEYDNGYESEDDLEFYMFLYEELLRGRSNGYRRSRTYGNPYTFYRRQSSPETPEQYQTRVRRTHEEQVEAQERRARESAARKLRLEKERKKEREEAEERQKARASEKRAKAEALRKDAQMAIHAQQKKAQTLRSNVFAAAHSGDTEKVKKGIWEDAVDAAGGEVKIGCDAYVTLAPKDHKETLSHIAARKGDVDLVLWLDNHSAEPDERDSEGYTAFHIALQHGFVPILKHFFESYPPKDAEFQAIYSAPEPRSLLSLALDSHEPEVIWIILDNGLASTQDIANAWARVSSGVGKEELKTTLGQGESVHDDEKAGDIRKLLMTVGGFTPPSTPVVSQNPFGEQRGTNRESERLALDREQNQKQKPQPRPPPRTPFKQLSSQSSRPNGGPDQQRRTFQGRGRGQGRTHGRRGGRGSTA